MIQRTITRLLANLLALTVTAACILQPAPQRSASAASASPAVRTTLRVGMWTLWHDREVVLIAARPPDRTLMRICERCAARVLRATATIRASGDGLDLAMGGKTVHSDGVWFTGTETLTAHGESVTLHNPVSITARANVLVIVATLPVESYVERVVASESGPADSPESLKALAIVVRSFALHEAHGHADYDLCDSTHCQLLHWSANSDRWPAVHAAVLATSGETLWFHGQRALAYFGKDCGGHTASPAEIWPRARSVPYLPSQPDRFCTSDGGREWASQISRAELTAALAAHGLAKPGWQNLVVTRRGESGRAIALRLDGNEISAEAFRLAVGESLGWSRIPSTWFEVSRNGDRFAFHGRGWGNGVGLCQKGAAAMAAQGHSMLQILEKYFPGTNSADEATGQTWQSLTGDGFELESLDSADAAYLPELNRARGDASRLSGLNSSSSFTVRAFASTPAFRTATLAPGWFAAFTEGDWIGTQPLRTFAARHLLASVMRHEFLHALVEQQAGPRTPLWLREGLVEAWSESASLENRPRSGGPSLTGTLMPEAINAALTHASTEAESEAAHRAAASYAAQLLAKYGRAQVLEWLRSGVPASAVAPLRQR